MVTEERLTELGLASQNLANREAGILRSQAVMTPSLDVNSVVTSTLGHVGRFSGSTQNTHRRRQ